MSDSLDPFLDHEQAWHGNERREFRDERKVAQRTDRSKYKKSDLDALAKRKQADLAPSSTLAYGQIVEIRAGDIFVLCKTNPDAQQIGKLHLVHVKGSFKQARSRTKNLVAVGDFVFYDLPSTSGSGQIQEIAERRTILSRADNLNHTKEQILATNVDFLVIVFALCQPMLSLNLIDRYLIAAAQGGLSPILVISKVDLLENESLSKEQRLSEQTKYEMALTTYRALDLPVISYRQDQPESLKPLEVLLQGHTCVVSGPSGVGKSTLLSFLTGKDLRVQPVCHRTGLGSHTTSHAQFVPLKVGGWCVDTPGIRSLGLWLLEKAWVDRYFDEISQCAPNCKFRDCKHLHEPGCSVIEKVNSGTISKQRYASYLSLMEELNDQHLRR